MTRIMNNTKEGFTVRASDETFETGDSFLFFARDGKHYQFNLQGTQFYYRELPDDGPVEPWKELVDIAKQLDQYKLRLDTAYEVFEEVLREHVAATELRNLYRRKWRGEGE